MSSRRKEELDEAVATLRWALKSESAPRLNAMVDLARSEPGVPILPEAMDKDPWLFNCANGTVDLRTGTIRDHRQDDYLTKLCPTKFDPRAEAPVFQQFLRDIFADDAAIITFVHRLLGYSLTGDVREQVLAIWHGSGANGKSTLINAVSDTVGEDYVIKATRDLFMAKKGDSHPTQMARLFGKRLVVCVETADGSRLDEALVKELTGGDKIAARRMKEDYWEFTPTHKAILVTNHQPEIRGTDHAIWRRIRLVPFNERFEADKQDKELGAKLKAEAPGILAWLVQGCLEWQRHGLPVPEAVAEATSQYRSSQDLLGAFLDEACAVGNDYRVSVSDIYGSYRTWCERNGHKDIGGTAFGRRMGERGFKKDPGRRWYLGLMLTAFEEQLWSQ